MKKIIVIFVMTIFLVITTSYAFASPVDGFERTLYIHVDCNGIRDGTPFIITVNDKQTFYVPSNRECSEQDKPKYSIPLGIEKSAKILVRWSPILKIWNETIYTVSELGISRFNIINNQTTLSVGLAATITAPNGSTANLFYYKTRYSVPSVPPTQPNYHPVIIAEGIDQLNRVDALTFYKFLGQAGSGCSVCEGKHMLEFASEKFLDVWLIDWFDGGSEMEKQADDFQYIAKKINEWNNQKNTTVVLALSMGGVSSRLAIAQAYDKKENLGIQKFITGNSPHRGAWINPGLIRIIKTHPDINDRFRRAVTAPVVDQLLVYGNDHERFYKMLRSHGVNGYDPRIENIAFTTGHYGNTDGTDLIEKRAIRRMLNIWLIINGIKDIDDYADTVFNYDDYPGDKLGSIRPNVFISVLFGLWGGSTEWQVDPTFIPTHSALDFDETLEIVETKSRTVCFSYCYTVDEEVLKYKNTKSPFDRVYINPEKKSAEHLALAVHADTVMKEVFASFAESCIVPISGDWIIKNSCKFSGNAKVPGNVIVSEGKSLTISENSALDVDLSKYNIRIKKGAKIVIKKGGKIY